MDRDFLIVVPVLDGESGIGRTLESVAALQHLESVHLHVQDGASSDSTVRRVEEFYRSVLSVRPDPPGLTICSERDGGMYDAIHRAFGSYELSDRQWLTWINAGDTLERDALATVKLVSDSPAAPGIDWVTGAIRAQLSETGLYEKSSPAPLMLIREGLADNETLPFLQQEGTFFRYGLYKCARFDKFVAHRAAGDYFLWLDLAHYSTGLAYSPKPLATWHQQEGQLSERLRHVYSGEIEALRPRFVRAYRREVVRKTKMELFVVENQQVERRMFALTESGNLFAMPQGTR